MNQTEITPFTVEPSSGRTLANPAASPFKLVVDPVMRARLRQAIFTLIENHDEELARHFSEDRLSLDSYKEYVELFARSLKETMGSMEGVTYLLRSCGFEVDPENVNLHPETRWKK